MKEIIHLLFYLDNFFVAESDTWYGAKFSKDIDKITDGCVKLKPPLVSNETIRYLYFHNVFSLDILWKTKETIKEVQLEEFKNDDFIIQYDNDFYYPVRYIHAEYNCKTKCFFHFDGAIHLYRKSEYKVRRENDFKYVNKLHKIIKSRSVKIFKINGDLDIDTWISYTSHFLSGDPLVNEYFQGSFPQNVQYALKIVKET